jgi:hypothetical protein
MQHGIDLRNIKVSGLSERSTMHQSAHLTSLLELIEECRLQLALPVVVGVEGFEDSVQALEKECPEVVKWAKVPCTIGNVSCIVVIWFDNARSVELVPSLIQQ